MPTSNQCLSCKHYQMFGKCEAFPEEIPDEIYEGQFDHRKKFPGQENEILWEGIAKELLK